MPCRKFIFHSYIHYSREQQKEKDRDELWKQLDRLKLEHDSKAKPLSQQETPKK